MTSSPSSTAQPVKDDRELTRRVGALKPGDKAEIVVLRSGKELA